MINNTNPMTIINLTQSTPWSIDFQEYIAKDWVFLW